MDNLDPAAAFITFFGFLVALTMHEAAKAYAARALGDKSPETTSRATINPIPHIDIFGTIVFPLIMLFSGINFLFGWAKPLVFDTRFFKKMKRDINIVSLAGPGFNFLLAIVCGIALRQVGLESIGLRDTSQPLPLILNSVAIANIIIGIFNLIPFPGSDGWRILTNSVNYNLSQKLQALSTPISIALLLFFILGFFHPIVYFVLQIFYTIVAL